MSNTQDSFSGRMMKQFTELFQFPSFKRVCGIRLVAGWMLPKHQTGVRFSYPAHSFESKHQTGVSGEYVEPRKTF